jgi:hypothetical protein
VVVDGRAGSSTATGSSSAPALLDNVTTDMAVLPRRDLRSGAVVVRVDGYQEGIDTINANPYANGTAIFTRDGGAARQFQFDVEVGMVGVNVPVPVPVGYYSFGGWKNSLFGDTHMYGPEGINFYTRAKVVTSRWPDPSTSTSTSASRRLTAVGHRPHRRFCRPRPAEPPPARVIDLAKRAETLRVLARVDVRLAHPVGGAVRHLLQDPRRDPQRIVVGPMVTNPATRDWTVTASTYATLNEMYGNRTVCGIGRGDSAVRVTNGKPTTLATMGESIHVIRELANGRSVDYKGSTITLPWASKSRARGVGRRATGRRR